VPAEVVGGLGLGAGRSRMRAGIVDDSAQPVAGLLEQRDDVGLVEIIGEEVERERLVGGNLLEEVHDQIVGLEAEPLVDIARHLLEFETVVGIRWDDVRIALILVLISLG
jgi:hypothetical protein